MAYLKRVHGFLFIHAVARRLGFRLDPATTARISSFERERLRNQRQAKDAHHRMQVAVRRARTKQMTQEHQSFAADLFLPRDSTAHSKGYTALDETEQLIVDCRCHLAVPPIELLSEDQESHQSDFLWCQLCHNPKLAIRPFKATGAKAHCSGKAHIRNWRVAQSQSVQYKALQAAPPDPTVNAGIAAANLRAAAPKVHCGCMGE